MKKVFIIHGFDGQPNGDWRPWLMGELAKKDIYACALPMPTPEKPEKDEWVKTIVDAVGEPNNEFFLVGHSLGSPIILRYLETLNGVKISGVVLVSGPAFPIERGGYEKVNKFLDTSFDFEKIKTTCNNFVIIHGDNDPNVPFSDAEYLSKNLSCDLISVPNGGHLAGHDGFYELPQLLEVLEKMLKI